MVGFLFEGLRRNPTISFFGRGQKEVISGPGPSGQGLGPGPRALRARPGPGTENTIHCDLGFLNGFFLREAQTEIDDLFFAWGGEEGEDPGRVFLRPKEGLREGLEALRLLKARRPSERLRLFRKNERPYQIV